MDAVVALLGVARGGEEGGEFIVVGGGLLVGSGVRGGGDGVDVGGGLGEDIVSVSGSVRCWHGT